jgi:hypothetical protein
MVVIIRATSVSLLLALAACSVGEVPIGGVPNVDSGVPVTDGPAIDTPGAVDPATSFTMLIKPLVMGAGCLACHPALNAPDFGSFDKLDPKYVVKPGSGSKLVTQGDHQNIKYLPAAQVKIIQDWLDSLPAQ